MDLVYQAEVYPGPLWYRVHEKLAGGDLPQELHLPKMMYLTDTLYGCVQAVRDAVGHDLTMRAHTESGFIGSAPKAPLMVVLLCDDLESPLASETRHLKVFLYGTREAVEAAYASLTKLEERIVHVNWKWWNGKYVESTPFFLREERPFHKEFYPWMEDPDKLIDEFYASDENTLILLGDPGTGKTSFIRHMLLRCGGNAQIAYDQEVMQKDSLYTEFLKSDNSFLVLEDADLVLTDRVTTGNSVMSKMLNATDGVVSFKKKTAW